MAKPTTVPRLTEGKKIAKLAECTNCGQAWEIPLQMSARSACQICGAPMKEVGQVREVSHAH